MEKRGVELGRWRREGWCERMEKGGVVWEDGEERGGVGMNEEGVER